MEENRNAEIIAGGAILLIVLVAFIAKLMTNVFLELAQACDAFGKMLSTFIPMLWVLLKIVFLAALIIGSIIGAVYFTIKYHRMVKAGTALQEHIDRRIQEFENKSIDLFDQLGNGLRSRVYHMESKLEAALAKPELAPPAPVVEVKAEAIIERIDSQDPDEETDPDSETDSEQNEENAPDQIMMSNRY